MIDLHGDVDEETGKKDIVNAKVMAELKMKRYADDKIANKQVSTRRLP